MHHLARALVPQGVRHLLPRSSKRVVVVGGGPAGMFCADRLRHHFEVTVVDPKEYFEFTPSILRAVVDSTHLSRITFDYREVLEENLGVEFVKAHVQRIEPASSGGSRRGSVVLDEDGRRVQFDYCVVAPGLSNGIWKPQVEVTPEPSPSALPGSTTNPNFQRPETASTEPGIGTSDERTIAARRLGLQATREKLARSRRVVIIGAGLVGVELAGEIAHFYPHLKIRLVDGAPAVLPQLSENAQAYAKTWLEQQGVRLLLGAPFKQDMVEKDDIVFWCLGTKSRAQGLFDESDGHVLNSKGLVRVNRHMQVVRKKKASIKSTSSDEGEPAAAFELEPFGLGRIYAAGDAAEIQGVPTAQVIFHGEEMAAIAVANIEASEDIASPFNFTKTRREADGEIPLLCCASLGPRDGIFSTQSEMLATGLPVAFQKMLIEETKMGALKGELHNAIPWMPVH